MIRLPTAIAAAACLGLGACMDESGSGQAAATPETMIRATVIASGRAASGEVPRLVLLADGKEVGEASITASRADGKWGVYEFDWRGSRPSVLAVRYANDLGDRDLWVRKVVLDGAELAPSWRRRRGPMCGTAASRFLAEAGFPGRASSGSSSRLILHQPPGGGDRCSTMSCAWARWAASVVFWPSSTRRS
jgi:hypothetical protein